MFESQKETYRDEVNDLLLELENALLELEERPGDREVVGKVFRAMHTIKGSGAMLGFDDVAAFTHDIETVFDGVRNGDVPVTKHLLDLTLKACDQIKGMIEGKRSETETKEEVLRGFRDLLPKERTGSGDLFPYECLDSEEKGDVPDVTYRIHFEPPQGIFRNGGNPILLLDELRELGECTVVGHASGIPSLEEIDPESCYMAWDVLLTTSSGIHTIKDVFLFVEDGCELHIETIEDKDLLGDGLPARKLGEILVDRGQISQKDLSRALSSQKRVGELLVAGKAIDRDTLNTGLAEQLHIKEVNEKRKRVESLSNVKVSTDKLDRLVDLVGELVIAQERLTQTASSRKDPMLIAIAEEVERMTAELRDNAMSIRMLPIDSTFTRFRRLVRDLSAELGKDILMIMEGGETELDKTVIERLNDPLVHIIRNSIDHGIEMPDVREALGKPRQGVLRLSAFHSGANVMIRISDDGAGLDAMAIRAKAVERGLLSAEAEISDKEIFSLIFEPGFSTAGKVTGISGRGVGMDVVKKSVEILRGTVEVSSQKGKGTTVTLKLPLTLAIIDGLMVGVGEDSYVIPLAAVEECIELKREMEKASNRKMVNLRDEIVPYIPLRDLFGIEGPPPTIQKIVIADVNGERVGFVVDHVMGKTQTVIKTLGRLYSTADELSGATILGDGTVALVLELPNLVGIAEGLQPQ